MISYVEGDMKNYVCEIILHKEYDFIIREDTTLKLQSQGWHTVYLRSIQFIIIPSTDKYVYNNNILG